MRATETSEVSEAVRAARRFSGFMAALLATLLLAAQAPVATAQETAADAVEENGEVLEGGDASTEFDAMPTADLFDLYMDVGLVLKKRSLLPDGWNPAQDYAEILIVKALGLTREASGGRATGPGGVRFRIVGLRLDQSEAAPRISGLSPIDFDRLAIVMFERRFVIEHAVVTPSDLVSQQAPSGALVVDTALLDDPRTEEITARVDRLTGDEF